MLDRYIIIDVGQMIKDYDDNKDALDAITEQYSEICGKGIRSIDYLKDRVQDSNFEDAAANLMARKEALQEKISCYKRFFSIYDPAWAKLTDQEKFVLIAFCKAGYREKQSAADRVCEKYNIETRQAYYKFNQAKDRFKRLMFG